MATAYSARTKPTTTYTEESRGSTITAGMPIGLLLALTYAVENEGVGNTTYTPRTEP